MGGETVFRLAKGLEYLGQPVCKCFLVLDALINSWCAISLSICMFAILFKESNAKDVVFDAAGVADEAVMDVETAKWEDRLAVPERLRDGMYVITKCIYKSTQLVLMILLVLAIPTPFLLRSSAESTQ